MRRETELERKKEREREGRGEREGRRKRGKGEERGENEKGRGWGRVTVGPSAERPKSKKHKHLVDGRLIRKSRENPDLGEVAS